MAAMKLWRVGMLAVALFQGVKAAECDGAIIGPVVAVAVIAELVTVAIAVVSCLYLKIKLKQMSEEVGDQKPRLYSYSENGDDTIRVVHNTLYETLTRDRKNKINRNMISETPVASASESHQPPASVSSHDPERDGHERSNSQEDAKDTPPASYAAASETEEPDEPPTESREDILEGLSDGSVTVDASITAF